MDSATLQGLSFISMASNNSPVLPRAIFSQVTFASTWRSSVINGGECGPRQMLNSPEKQQVNQSESTEIR